MKKLSKCSHLICLLQHKMSEASKIHKMLLIFADFFNEVSLLPKVVNMLAQVMKCKIILISDFAFDCFMSDWREHFKSLNTSFCQPADLQLLLVTLIC